MSLIGIASGELEQILFFFMIWVWFNDTDVDIKSCRRLLKVFNGFFVCTFILDFRQPTHVLVHSLISSLTFIQVKLSVICLLVALIPGYYDYVRLILINIFLYSPG